MAYINPAFRSPYRYRMVSGELTYETIDGRYFTEKARRIACRPHGTTYMTVNGHCAECEPGRTTPLREDEIDPTTL